MLCRALEAVGLRDFRIGLGDAALFPRLLDEAGVDGAARDSILRELATRRLRRPRARAGRARPSTTRRTELLLRVARLRGGPEVLEDVGAEIGDAAGGLRRLYDGLLAGGGASGSSSTSASAATSATTRARCSRSTTRRSASRSAAAGATTTCSAGSAARCPAVGFALRIDDLHSGADGEDP